MIRTMIEPLPDHQSRQSFSTITVMLDREHEEPARRLHFMTGGICGLGHNV